MPHNRCKTRFGFAPLTKTGLDGGQQLVQVAEVEIVGGDPPRELPDPFDGSELRAIGRQEPQFQMRLVFFQQGGEPFGVVVAGVVEHRGHLSAARAPPEQDLQKAFEGDGVEPRRKGVNEFAAAQADRAAAGDRLARRRGEDDRVPVLGRPPRAATGAVELEVAFVLAPQSKVLPFRQPAKFFYPPPRAPGRPAPASDAASAGGSPSAGTTAGTAARPVSRHSPAAGVRTVACRPTDARPSQSRPAAGAGPLPATTIAPA